MTVKQKVILVAAILIFAALIVFTVWFLRRPQKTPDGVLVYKEAYMRMADQPWQGERLCHGR